jgi:alpha-tubulin suppressor-like RCC1 family protein
VPNAAGIWHDALMRAVAFVLLGCSACGFSVATQEAPDATIDGAVDAAVDAATPPDVLPSCGAVEIATGGDHTCARRLDGALLCWGYGAYGQLGIAGLQNRCTVANGSTGFCEPTPKQVQLAGVTGLGLGAAHSCATTATGVHCWGLNQYGAYGDGSTTRTIEPVLVTQRGAATAIAGGTSHACSLAAGSVSCAGRNLSGEVGDGSTMMALTATPVATGATAIAVGDYTSCALDASGAIRCWGANNYRQIDATLTPRLSPTTVPDVTSAVQIAVGRSHVCARFADGTARCWGNNSYGQLGNGATALYSAPVAINASGIDELDATRNLTCVRVGGEVSCVGEGVGTTLTRVPLPRPATSVSLGSRHACAITDDYSVWCWGDQQWGQLGNGVNDLTPESQPVQAQICP